MPSAIGFDSMSGSGDAKQDDQDHGGSHRRVISVGIWYPRIVWQTGGRAGKLILRHFGWEKRIVQPAKLP